MGKTNFLFMQIPLLTAINLNAQGGGKSAFNGFVRDELGILPGVALHIRRTKVGNIPYADGLFIINTGLRNFCFVYVTY
jgi:hypothetical protein